MQSLNPAIGNALLNGTASHPDLVACRVVPILVAVMGFVKEYLGGELPATAMEGPSYSDFKNLPFVAIYELATWLLAKVTFLGSDSLASMPDKVIFCRALRHAAPRRCQTSR